MKTYQQYVTCINVLHAWGQQAWPWSVALIWTYVGSAL